MEVKPGYKPTEVGVIPEEWDVNRLDTLGSGFAPAIKAGPFGSSLTKDTYVPSGYKVYGQEQVIRGDYLFGDYFISVSKFRDLQSCSVRPGDILLSLVGTAGKLLVIPDGAPEGIINPRLIRFSFDKKRVCPQFFRELFETGQIQSLLTRHAQGGTMGVLNAGMLRPLKIALPPLPEQQAIAGALGDVDALLGALEQLIAKKRDLKQAAMQQLLTGQTRLPGFTGKWETLNMSEKSSLKARIGWQGLTTAEYLKTGEYYLVTGTDFANGRIDWSHCCFVAAERYVQDRNIQLRPKDILLTKDGTIGKVGFVDDLPGPATLNSGVFVIRPKEDAYNPQFFYYVLTSRIFDDFLTKLQAGSTISHLYQKDFVTFAFLAPVTVAEQTAIAGVLSDMDAELAALEARLAKTRALKQGMMQELLTGRTRLI